MNIERDTLVVDRNGWCVYRPYATGVDTGPARYVGRAGEPWTADMLREFNETILPYYTRAGFTIKGRAPQ